MYEIIHTSHFTYPTSQKGVNMSKPKVIVICGPTASGKTNLSIELAKKIDGEIISADSMQIYKDMNIGTAKPTLEEMKNIKHHLIGFVSPEERFSVSDYKKLAQEKIIEILNIGKKPIVVGGTGLYINSLIYGIEYGKMTFDQEYREKLEKIAIEKGNQYIYEMAKNIDEEAIKNIQDFEPKPYIENNRRMLEIIENFIDNIK